MGRYGCYRNTPVCPKEYRPGCGYTHNPCGPCPTGIRAMRSPLLLSIAYTSELKRPDSHSTFPSADTPPISGLPPPGSRHFLATLLDAKSITEMLPSSRFDTYSMRESRLTYRPCAPLPVDRKSIFFR